MDWKTPSYVEIRMDAEISAYQDEADPMRNPPIVEAETTTETAAER
jgi:coenzyme PQQ precursor peptide PqqA